MNRRAFLQLLVASGIAVRAPSLLCAAQDPRIQSIVSPGTAGAPIGSPADDLDAILVSATGFAEREDSGGVCILADGVPAVFIPVFLGSYVTVDMYAGLMAARRFRGGVRFDVAPIRTPPATDASMQAGAVVAKMDVIYVERGRELRVDDVVNAFVHGDHRVITACYAPRLDE